MHIELETIDTTIEYIDQVIAACDKFIAKVDSGNARSVETYQDLVQIRTRSHVIRAKLIHDKVSRSQ